MDQAAIHSLSRMPSLKMNSSSDEEEKCLDVLVKNFVRLTLFAEYNKVPLKREDYMSKCKK